MPVRNETLFKWSLYAAATALVFLVQGLALRHVELWGVFPFLFPVLTAVLGMYEGGVRGVTYGLVIGVLCDLTLAGPLPCFYTLALPLTGLAAALISGGLVSAGFLCSIICSAVAFAVTDGFHCLLLLLDGQSVWPSAALLAGRETAVSLLFLPLVFFPFRAIFRRCHVDD